MPQQNTILNNAKELDQETGWYYYGARYYDPQVSTWLSVDPLAEKYPAFSPYNFTMNNPVRLVDIKGLDTLDVTRQKNKWVFTNYKKVEGNDVIRVHVGDMTYSYTYSEGEYGKRVMALTLPEDTKDNFGIYLVSGAKLESGAYGYFVTPGGSRSNRNNSKKTIMPGIYGMRAAEDAQKWKTIQLIGNGGNTLDIAIRGIALHPATDINAPDDDVKASIWTKGCFVISSDYSIKDHSVQYNKLQSQNAAILFYYNTGATSFFSNTYTDSKGRIRTKLGATFSNGLDYNSFIFGDSNIH